MTLEKLHQENPEPGRPDDLYHPVYPDLDGRPHIVNGMRVYVHEQVALSNLGQQKLKADERKRKHDKKIPVGDKNHRVMMAGIDDRFGGGTAQYPGCWQVQCDGWRRRVTDR